MCPTSASGPGCVKTLIAANEICPENVEPVSHRLSCQMKRFIKGEDRGKYTMLPELLDDYIDEDKQV